MRYGIAVLAFVASAAFGASPVALPRQPAPVFDFNFDSIPVSDLVRVVYVHAMPNASYSVDPAVLNDKRLVSFRYKSVDGDFKAAFSAFLGGLGYELVSKGRSDAIRPATPVRELSAVESKDDEIFIYTPRHVDSAVIVESLSPLFNGRFTGQRKLNIDPPKSVPAAGAASQPSQSSGAVVAKQGSLLDQANRNFDKVIFVGSRLEVAALKKLLPQVDVELGQVVVSGALYEVQTGDRQASALQLAASLLSDRFSFSLGGVAQAVDNFLSIRAASVSLIMQALDTDSRFKVLSSPSLRVSSGQSASLTVGEDVPVLGSVTYPTLGGAPVQSVEYRSSGVLFTIAPVVRDASISVHVDQQVSSFVNTTTGVNNSPTLTKRQLSTSVNMTDGDVVVIGGLRQNKRSSAVSRVPFLPAIFGSNSRDNVESEVLLFLQVSRVSSPP